MSVPIATKADSSVYGTAFTCADIYSKL